MTVRANACDQRYYQPENTAEAVSLPGETASPARGWKLWTGITQRHQYGLHSHYAADGHRFHPRVSARTRRAPITAASKHDAPLDGLRTRQAGRPEVPGRDPAGNPSADASTRHGGIQLGPALTTPLAVHRTALGTVSLAPSEVPAYGRTEQGGTAASRPGIATPVSQVSTDRAREVKVSRHIGLPGVREPVSPGLRHRVLMRDRGTCRYCGSVRGPFHIDHVLPVKDGGRSTLRNLVTACPPCNQRKGVSYWEPLTIEAALRVERIRRTRTTDTVATERANPTAGDRATRTLRDLRDRRRQIDARRVNGLS